MRTVTQIPLGIARTEAPIRKKPEGKKQSDLLRLLQGPGGTVGRLYHLTGVGEYLVSRLADRCGDFVAVG